MLSDKQKLVNEIQEKIQDLTLLLSVIKEDRSRKPELLLQYRYQYEQRLNVKPKKK